MHELSIAMSILELAAEEAERQGHAHVVAVHVRVGALSGVVKEALESAYELARDGSPLADARLNIEEVPVRILCPACGDGRDVISVQELRCRVCGTLCAEVIQGRELELCALEVDE